MYDLDMALYGAVYTDLQLIPESFFYATINFSNILLDKISLRSLKRLLGKHQGIQFQQGLTNLETLARTQIETLSNQISPKSNSWGRKIPINP